MQEAISQAAKAAIGKKNCMSGWMFDFAITKTTDKFAGSNFDFYAKKPVKNEPSLGRSSAINVTF